MSEIRDAIADLSSALPGKLSLPGHDSYQSTEDGYYSKQEQEMNPACVLYPQCTDDVSTILKILSKYDVQFAVRGGGHTLNRGAANIDDGITINLRRMNQATVDDSKTLVSVSGGCKWHDVYSVLGDWGLATSGGRLSDVGVGGLTSGGNPLMTQNLHIAKGGLGGISYFSSRYGLVCDNVENYEVVLANGEVIQANRNQNEDLWLALKGGSNNFGIVSRFDLRAFPQGKLFGGVIIYPHSAIPDILRQLHILTSDFDPFAAAVISISWSPDNSKTIVFANFEYTKDETEPPALKPFLDIKPQHLNTMMKSSLTEVAMLASKYAAKGDRAVWATTTFKCNHEFLVEVHEIWKSHLSKVEAISGIQWGMTVQPFPPSFSQSSAHLGGNSLGLDPAMDGPMILFLLSSKWDDALNDAAVNAAARELIERIDFAAKKAGTYHRFRYLNYAASWQDPFEGYGESSRSHLRATSMKYDPNRVFQAKCSGGFKLFGRSYNIVDP